MDIELALPNKEAADAVKRAIAFVLFAAGEGIGFNDPETGYIAYPEDIICELACALGMQDDEDWCDTLSRNGLTP